MQRPNDAARVEPLSADETEFLSACREAFGKMIALARKLKSRGETSETIEKYGYEIGKIGIEAGFEQEETTRYGMRIWLMVQREHQA